MHVNVIVKENKEKSTVCNEHKVLFFLFLAHCHPQGYPIWFKSDWRSSECYVRFRYKIVSCEFVLTPT